MAKPVVMTALSPTMQDGAIAEWIAKEGQEVKSGDALCEIETDKATMPLESPSAGTLLKIIRTAGQKATVGETIAIIGKPGEDWQSLVSADTQPAPPAQATPPASAAPASAARANEPTAPAAAGSVQTTSAAFPALGPIPSETHQAVPNTVSAATLPATAMPSSPLARAMARDRGIDLRAVRGSGPRGRIVARDITAFAMSGGAIGAKPEPAVPAAAQPAAPSAGRGAPVVRRLRDERVPLSKMRTIIAQRLGASYSSAPHYFVRAAVDMERLLEMRASINSGREHPIGLNTFVMRLVAAALERHPVVNASWEGDAIRYRPSADIGLAVSLDAGLITPVVRSCESKSIAAIDAELADLVQRARSGSLVPEEYSEASFTISNLGSYGVEEFTAIINPPGSAILALGAITQEAVVINNAIVPRRMMHITLSSDHRVIDGAVAAAFVSDLKSLLQEPATALV